MATVNPQLISGEHHKPSAWYDSFEGTQRQRMLADDLQAGRSVSAVLISVVAAGLVAMILTVLYCVL